LTWVFIARNAKLFSRFDLSSSHQIRRIGRVTWAAPPRRRLQKRMPRAYADEIDIGRDSWAALRRCSPARAFQTLSPNSAEPDLAREIRTPPASPRERFEFI
jgi:hypothetical protein